MKKIHLNLVFCDEKGNIYDDPNFIAAGRSGTDILPLSLDEAIEIPYGSEFFILPQRYPICFDKKLNKIVLRDRFAVSVFLAPAYTQLYLPAYQREKNAPVLPLFAYTAVGFYKGKFYVPALRIDPDKRQDLKGFDVNKIKEKAKILLKKSPKNRLLKHIIENCALTYFCPAARNFVLGRFEAPLPTSRFCNSRCLGCISLQDKNSSPISCTQPRIKFTPTPHEIIEVALMHIERAKNPIVSFGQGCEGEPTLVSEVIEEAIKGIKRITSKGTINLNTNGSLTDRVKRLFHAGLDSIRVSLNSVRKDIYEAYYAPQNYSFEDVKNTIKLAVEMKKWVSLNYFVLPGITDSEEEFEELKNLLRETKVSMIQWRNFNIDPDWYFDFLKLKNIRRGLGIKNIMEELKRELPHLKYGYFNPYLTS